MVSGLSGVWFSLFLQRILMSRLHPAILRPSTGQSSESLPWSSPVPWSSLVFSLALPGLVWHSLVFPGLPWPSLAFLGLAWSYNMWSTVVCLVFAGLPSCSLAFPRLPRDCPPNLCSLLLYMPSVFPTMPSMFSAVPELEPSARDTSSSSSL